MENVSPKIPIRVERVWIEWLPDEYPDVSWLERTAADHYGKNGRNWWHVQKEHIRQVVRQYGSVKAACREYARQDAERLAAYERGQWCMTGCVAKAEVSYPIDAQGNRRLERFQSGGLWSIESDGGGEYHREIEQEELTDLRRHLAVFGIELGDVGAVEVRYA
jgi:hypothetical protein